MKKYFIAAFYLFVSLHILAQDKIPFIDYDQVSDEALEAFQANDYDKTIQILDKISKNDSTYCSVLITKSYYLINSKEYQKGWSLAKDTTTRHMQVIEGFSTE